MDLSTDQTYLQAVQNYVPPEVLAEISDLDDTHAFRARYDPCAFASYVLRDEETAKPITLSPMHEEWHALATYHKRLLVWAHIEAGKTQQFSIARVLYEIGRNPNIRVVIASNTFGQASKICTTIAKYIESSAEYHKVFPHIKRDKKSAWSSAELFVERTARSKDPTVRTCGVHGNIMGGRVDLLIVDDILDYENTLSLHQREDLYLWFQATLETRLGAKARVICVGTAWNRDDLYHRFAKRKDFYTVRYPVMDEQTFELMWPERWPTARIEEKREILGPVEFNRACLCIARSDEENRFQAVWIDWCKERGDGRRFPVEGLQIVPDGYACYTGVDLAVSKKSSAHLTSFFTLLIHPDGSREVLDIDAGRWSGPEIVNKIKEKHHYFNSIVIVENNAAQQYILDFTKDSTAIPIIAFTTTGQNIRHPQFGLESLATELSLRKWIIPSLDGVCHPQVQAWINEMLYYDPNAHPGDRLMSSWFAREGQRVSRPKAQLHKLDLLTR